MPRALALLAAAAALGMAAPAASAVFTFAQVLSPEVSDATGTGYAKVTFDTVSSKLRVQASWSGLSGNTTVAHIHCCVAPPGTVGVAVTPGTFPGFPAGVMAGTYDAMLDLGNINTYTPGFRNNFGGGTVGGARAALLLGLQQNRAYLNIHSSTFGMGEIRGFLTAVPEPASWAMMIAGFGLVGAALRRRVDPAFA